jgi:hypothetical protein
MGSLFGSFFGFIYWGVAGLRMAHTDYGSGFYRTRGIRGWVELFVNLVLILIGLFFLGPGTYVSTDSNPGRLPLLKLLGRHRSNPWSKVIVKGPSAAHSFVPAMALGLECRAQRSCQFFYVCWQHQVKSLSFGSGDEPSKSQGLPFSTPLGVALKNRPTSQSSDASLR